MNDTPANSDLYAERMNEEGAYTDRPASGRPVVKRTKGNRRLAELTKDDLLKMQHLPVHEAAATVGVGATNFKIRCREVGIKRWPFYERRRAIHKVARNQIQQQVMKPSNMGSMMHTAISQGAATGNVANSVAGSVLDECDAPNLGDVIERSEPETAEAIKSMLDRLITIPQAPPTHVAARADAVRFLAVRDAIGEQATIQSLFDQYGSSLAAMPPGLAAMLGMCGVDPTAVVRCVQEFAVRTIVNVLQDIEQRRAITASAVVARAQAVPSAPPLSTNGSMQPHAATHVVVDPVNMPLHALQQVQLSLDSFFASSSPSPDSRHDDTALQNDMYAAPFNNLFSGDTPPSADLYTGSMFSGVVLPRPV